MKKTGILIALIVVLSSFFSNVYASADLANRAKELYEEQFGDFHQEVQSVSEMIEENRRKMEQHHANFDAKVQRAEIRMHMPKEIFKQAGYVKDYLYNVEQASPDGTFAQAKYIFDEFVTKVKEYPTIPNDVDSPVGLMLIISLVFSVVLIAGGTSHHKQNKYLYRTNGKASVFDCSDMSYSFNNDLHMQQMNMHNEFARQSAEFAMNESMKAVTPFDHGGYMQGEGFNPSDTMAAQANHQMDSMNDFNNMGMF